ncbi:MAG: DUF2239 family protein [Chlorobiaceae bacterium]|nr:DUF2239 family protein [Chlorobiaceae bacterium]
MKNKNSGSCIAFDGMRCIASGDLREVAVGVKKLIDRGEALTVLIFDDQSSEIVEIDFRGSADDVVERLERKTVSQGSVPETSGTEPEPRQGPGRPKLGVVPREVTLLPRHWEWLNCQPGGASVALRKLVEDARRANSEQDRLRASQESLYRFMSAMGGDLPGFEEASRAMFARDADRFIEMIECWPADIRDHARKLGTAAFRSAS